MLGVERQQAIKTELIAAETPISANTFAKKFGVSRQTVVGDIALLRAAGEEIVSTTQGYRYQPGYAYSQIVVVQHNAEQMEAELMALVDVGVTIQDVQVEHPLYGLLKGELALDSRETVEHFLKQYHTSQGALLSSLTSGLHMHTLKYDQPEQLVQAKAKLAELGILYEN